MFGILSRKSRAPVGEEFHSFWHFFEMGAFRTTIVAVSVIALLSIIIIYQYTALRSKDALIERLSKERVMIGYPDERGYFVSASKLPERVILNYARGFTANMFNWSSYNVVENLEEARKLMTPSLANDHVKFFEEIIATSKRDAVSRRFEIKAYKSPIQIRGGYIVQFQGLVSEYFGQTPNGQPRETTVTVVMQRIEPTKSTPEGLQVSGISDKPVDLRNFEIIPTAPEKAEKSGSSSKRS